MTSYYPLFSASAKVNYKLRLKKASDEYETLLLGELTRRRHPRSSWSFQEQFKIIKIKITQVALMSKNGEFRIKIFSKKNWKKFLKVTKTKIKF